MNIDVEVQHLYIDSDDNLSPIGQKMYGRYSVGLITSPSSPDKECYSLHLNKADGSYCSLSFGDIVSIMYNGEPIIFTVAVTYHNCEFEHCILEKHEDNSPDESVEFLYTPEFYASINGR